MADEDDLLTCLLDIAEAELNSLNGKDNTTVKRESSIPNVNNIEASTSTDITNKKTLHEIDLFNTSNSILDENELTPRRKKKFKKVEKGLSLIHEGQTDSSDDEGNRNFENQKYNEYGKEIKNLLRHSESSSSLVKEPRNGLFSQSSAKTSNWKTKPTEKKINTLSGLSAKTLGATKGPVNVYTDPIFGISIVSPLISSKVFEERMSGRKAVPICQISKHLRTLNKDEDWVIAGVLCNKGVTKTSAKGNQFVVWTMSDLLGDIKTIAMFLFGNACEQFWKTQPGSVVGILNPSILDRKEGSRDEATLSVDNAQKVMVLGQSRDLGVCKTVKKNGDKCTAIVNKSRCEFCVYHIRQEYQKCSQRSDLQANFSGKGLIALRNKVLGKNEVFYAGKSYKAIPAKQSRKLMKKDQNRLHSLTSSATTITNLGQPKNKPIQKAATSFDVVRSRRMKDMEMLKKLGVDTAKYGNNIQNFKANHSAEVTLDESKANALKILNNLKDKTKKPSPNSKDMLEKNLQVSPGTELQTSLDEFIENGLVDLDFDFKTVQRNSDSLGAIKEIGTSISGHKKTSNGSSKSQSLLRDHSLDSQNVLQEKKILPPVSSKLVNGDQNQTSCGLGMVHKSKEKISDLTQTGKQVPQTVVNNSRVTNVENFYSSSLLGKVPSLSQNGICIDLSKPIISRQANRAKINALKFVQKNGPLAKVNPNNVKGSGVKRKLDIVDPERNEKLKKIKENEFLSDRFKKMMEIQSKHMDLVEARDDEEKEKYFNKLEVKERLEEKMSTTYKIECKAVRCMTCKYTSFSAADRCKAEKHRLRVFDAMKRFFKCGHCGNRIACLDVVPVIPCKNCGSGNWERTTMMKEKSVSNTVALSIRGGEQKYTNSVVTDANINLLVPDED